MKLGFLGLPGGGKTTCFCMVTGRELAELAGRAESHIAVVKIPDERLPRLADIFGSARMVEPELTFVDVMALHKGESGSVREEKLTRVAGDADAFALVIQCHGDLDHEANPLDPRADLEALLLETVLTDLAVVEGRLARIDAELKASRDRTSWERDLLQRVADQLSADGVVRDLEFTADEDRQLRGFNLLTQKPLLVVLNVAEDDMACERAGDALELASERGLSSIAVSAELELELAELAENERGEFLAGYGLTEPGRDRFIRACYELLDAITFFTANRNEAHAWTITAGATAHEAAGKVHSDMYEGFIRAQVIPFDKLDELGSEAACREAGVARLEGRDYVVREGDVLEIRFSR